MVKLQTRFALRYGVGGYAGIERGFKTRVGEVCTRCAWAESPLEFGNPMHVFRSRRSNFKGPAKHATIAAVRCGVDREAAIASHGDTDAEGSVVEQSSSEGHLPRSR